MDVRHIFHRAIFSHPTTISITTIRYLITFFLNLTQKSKSGQLSYHIISEQ